MTKKEYEFIGSLNMTDQISNEAYGQIMIVAEDEPEECEDCIRRQAVFDVIEAYKYLDGNDAIYRLKQWLEDQEPVTPIQKWVPVTERLPKKGELVLVWYEYFRYGNYNSMYQTYGIGYQYNGFWGGDVSGTNARCIAWMPLPEAYQED